VSARSDLHGRGVNDLRANLIQWQNLVSRNNRRNNGRMKTAPSSCVARDRPPAAGTSVLDLLEACWRTALTLESMHAHVHAGGGPTRVLKISLAVTLAYIVLVAAAFARIPGLLSEAGHNLSDFLALLLSLVAVYFQSRPASSTKTYGYHRAGVLAGWSMPLRWSQFSFFIFYEAFRRLPASGAGAGQRDDVGGSGRRG